MNRIPSASIVIPTRDGMETLPRLLDAIAQQTEASVDEILAVDSGSRDGSAECLERRGARVIRVAPEAFNHGETRNLGIRETRGDLVVLLVQDAVPASEKWLRELLTPLVQDSAIAGTFARQLPWPDASALTRWSLHRWLASAQESRVVGPITPAQFEALAPASRHDLCVFDNVCSCIRRQVWTEIPFRPVIIAEDLEWGRDVLLAGHRLAYVPSAAVWHSHDRGPLYEFRRTYEVHRRLNELFALRTIPTVRALAESIVRTLPEHVRIAWADPRRRTAVLRATALAVAWPAGQYLGGKGSRA